MAGGTGKEEGGLHAGQEEGEKVRKDDKNAKASQEEGEKVRKDENGSRLVGDDHVGHEEASALPKRIDKR